MPLLWISLAFLTGVLLGEVPGWSTATWLGLAGLTLGSGLILRLLRARFSSRSPRFDTTRFFFLAAALCLGGARFQAAQPDWTDPGFIHNFIDTEQELVVTGVLVAPPDELDAGANLRVKVESLHPAGELSRTPVHGLLLARTRELGDWRYGDRLVLRGYLTEPFENEEFSYREYLARQGVYAYMGGAEAAFLERAEATPVLGVLYDLRVHAHALVYRYWPDPEASLMSGILLGIERGIPEPVQEAFKDTGTSHIIAISGFNITLVAGLLVTLFGRALGPRRGAALAALGIGAYTILVGGDAAVVRAALMGGLSLLAQQFGRRQHGLTSLAFVAGLMALADPNVLWDVGFQLSFAATLGLVLYADPLTEAFTRLASRRLPENSVQRLAGPVGEYLLFTLAAQVTTLPLMAYYFQKISFSALIANPFILPAQPPLMILGGLAVISGLLVYPLGQAIAWLAWPFVVYTIRAVELFAGWRGGALELGAVSWLVVGAFYTLLLGWTFGGSRIRAWFRERLPGSGLRPSLTLWTAGLGLLAVLTWRAALDAPDGQLHLTVLPVEGGEALLIRSPTGRAVLVDGGNSARALSDALGRRLPLFHRELDYLVVALPEEDNLAALPRAIGRFPPAAVLWAGPSNASFSARDLSELLADEQIPVTQAEAGQALDLGGGAQLRVLSASRLGAVLCLEMGNFRAVLPVGANFEDLEMLQNESYGPVSALLLAQGGYAPLNPPELIQALHPQVALLSVSAGNREGLPDPETLEAVAGYPLLRTDLNGWIELSTDGEQMWVEVEWR